MVHRDTDGKITLSWAQAAWSIATIATVVGCYYGLQTKIDRVVFTVNNNTARIESLEAHNRTVGFDRADAEQMRAEIDEEVARVKRIALSK